MTDKIETGAGEALALDILEQENAVQRMGTEKNIALVAHDNKKADLLDWACYNSELLTQHTLYATGTTGRLLSQELGAAVHCLQSGPLGGDQQIGARIAEGLIDMLVFFWDPLEPQPHDTDVKALLRVAVVWNIPFACDRATADYLISSPLMTGQYERQLPDYHAHTRRYNSPPGRSRVLSLPPGR